MTVTNTFAFNGVTLSHQPSNHKWSDRDLVGVDGNGTGVYTATREFEMSWDFLDASEFSEIYQYFTAQGVTGSIVSSLPKWNGNPYSFQAYSGTILREPTFEGFFENYYQSVKLLIVRITGT